MFTDLDRTSEKGLESFQSNINEYLSLAIPVVTLIVFCVYFETFNEWSRKVLGCI